MMIVVSFALFSCERSEIPGDGSGLTFSQTCDLEGNDVEVVDKLIRSLQYTTLSPVLPLWIINLPYGHPRYDSMQHACEFEMVEGESRSVTFSGHVLVYPENIDALSPDLELRFLKFG